MNRKPIIAAVLVALAGIGLLVGFGARHVLATKQGEVALIYNLSDTSGISAQFNGKAQRGTAKGTTVSYKINEGHTKLIVGKPGFQVFSADLTVKAGQPITVNVQLRLSSDSTITDIQQVSLPGGVAPGVQVSGAQYFYSNTWAVITLRADRTDTAVAVIQYDAVAKTWNTILGPGTSFRASNVQSLPPLVFSYMNAKNLVNNGGSTNNG